MTDLVLTTFDWVPPPPRGFVRDLRVRWALEEAGLPYRVEGVGFEDRGADHLGHQPFGQVPWLTDGDLSIFESGAILLHLGGKSEALLPADPVARNRAVEWLFAALNSVEMATMPWSMFRFFGTQADPKDREWIDGFVKLRLDRLEAVLDGRAWLAGDFSIADIMMGDVLRLVDRFDRFDGLEAHRAVKDYAARAVARPAFVKAHADQMAFFAAADAARAG